MISAFSSSHSTQYIGNVKKKCRSRHILSTFFLLCYVFDHFAVDSFLSFVENVACDGLCCRFLNFFFSRQRALIRLALVWIKRNILLGRFVLASLLCVVDSLEWIWRAARISGPIRKIHTRPVDELTAVWSRDGIRSNRLIVPLIRLIICLFFYPIPEGDVHQTFSDNKYEEITSVTIWRDNIPNFYFNWRQVQCVFLLKNRPNSRRIEKLMKPINYLLNRST